MHRRVIGAQLTCRAGIGRHAEGQQGGLGNVLRRDHLVRGERGAPASSTRLTKTAVSTPFYSVGNPQTALTEGFWASTHAVMSVWTYPG